MNNFERSATVIGGAAILSLEKELSGIRPDLFETKNVNPVILIRQIDETAAIHEHIFRLRDQATGLESNPGYRVGGHKITDLFRLAHIADVVHSQPGIEVGEISDVVAVFETGLMIRMMVIVRTEPAALDIKIRQSTLRRRLRQRK